LFTFIKNLKSRKQKHQLKEKKQDSLPACSGPLDGHAGNGREDFLDYFQPLPAEDLKTGALPTICSMEDMQTYKRRQAQDQAGQLATPFANGGLLMEVHTPFVTLRPKPTSFLPHQAD